MLGYRRRSLFRAHAFLENLRADPTDLSSLKSLQMLLIDEISRSELSIRLVKAKIKEISLRPGIEAGKTLLSLERRVEGLRQRAYIWRCFGDAIAFVYLDKFALKQTFYSTETTSPKQDGGFIVGKEGLTNEIALLDAALGHGVPAMLTDLTNTIRHGDLCLMVGADPILIEVKTSKKMNERGKKQLKSIQKLQKFFETDKAEGLRGFSEVRRVVFRLPERTYVDQMNKCLVGATRVACAIRRPERGLYYVVLTRGSPPIDEVLSSLKLRRPWVYSLNSFKSSRTWAPYMPFVLTLRDAEALWQFIRGEIFIIVVLDLEVLFKVVRKKGIELTINSENGEYPLLAKLVKNEGIVGISEHILTRVGLEFVSPEWIVLSSVESMIQIAGEIKDE